ncbi:MAG: CpsB/CapC family capsule biosynthesis tyrosine phosphatase [Pseudomonadales bacterium]
MIDLHCHLLPGIDDGPDTLAEALELAQLAVDDGITHAVVTPHIHPGRWNNTSRSIASKLANFKKVLAHKCVPLQLGFAGEVRLTDQLIAQVDNHKIPCYGEYHGHQVMLLEFPHSHIIPGSEKLVAWLLAKGITPMIAHPERNKEIMKNPDRLNIFVKAGCLLQVTAGSVTGRFGGPARGVAMSLLEQDKVAVIASDAHNVKSRPPILSEAYVAIAKRFGEERAERLLIHTPAEIARSQFQSLAV